ncbi:Ig-like domain-containing protein [Cobetia sp. UIB-001]|uniref:Ig-like domain-containing protein n=1 Tax=Cobetia sp. UIB-001 TaxID=2717697 RepID=UPI00384B91A3
MTLESTATLVAPQGAIVVLEDGTQLVVPQGAPIGVEVLLAESRGEAPVDPAVEALREAIARGEDPTAIQEAPAAGESGGAPGSSRSGFLDASGVGREGRVERTSYEYESGFTDPEFNDEDEDGLGLDLDPTLPTEVVLSLSVDAPALTSDTTPTIVGTTDAEDGSTVTLVITDSDGNEQTVTATVENGTYTVDAETPLSEGEYSVEASVTDPAGNTATSNDVGEIDASAPALTVDAPALTSDTTPTIVGTTDADDGSTVTLVITDSDGNEQTVTATVENGTYSVDAETPLSEGEYSVEASVTDPAGNTATSNDVGEIDASAPALTVDAPALTSDTTPTIVGTTDAEDGSTVTLVITDSDGNEQTVTATVENGTYTVDAETPLSEGEYSVEASVTDPAGNTATSNDVGEIDASAPALTVDAPALTSDTTPTIVGTTDADDGSTVTLVITDSDGNEQTVTATVENGTYTVDAETPLSEGEYSVEASVTDPAGNTATSNDVGEIDASAPALTVDAPALTSDTTPTIVGTTDAEDGSTVTLVITDSDGNEQTVTATVENGTYTVDAETPLSEGEYSVEASVTDPAGNTATSNDVGEIDASAPALTVDAPALTSDTTPTIVGTTDAEDGSTVTLVITDSDGNEQTVTATVENGTYTVDAETPLSEGEYSVEASVTDPAGNTATSNDVGEIDASAPALTVDAPALTSDTTPTIVGTTDADDGSTVTLVITDSDGNEQTVTATVENGTYTVDAETPLSEGEYSVEASVTDPAGNTATSNDVGEIDASAPALTVDAPALTSDTTPTIVGTTDAEDGSTVTLVITDSDGNEQTVTATVENGTYTVDAETPLSEGEYSVEASVTDPAGNTATSNDVGEIDASAPALTVDAPALTSDTTPTIVGTTDADDGSTVTLVITDSDGNEQTVTATVENGTYTVDAETPLSEGEYSVEASVTDPAGNTATSNDVGEIDASAPALTVDAPALTSDTTPTIVGTTDAEDGSTVTLVITDSDGNEQTVTATVENGTYTVDAETPLSEGEYSVEASVTDPTGNTATSNDVGEIDASAPALTVDAPALTSDTTPTIVGTTDAEDGSTVTLVITDSDGNEQTVTATVENGTYTVDAETPLSEGEYSVEASVTDPAGNTATSNDVGEIDASAPALTVDAPALTSDTTPTIVGTTDAEDGSTVTLVITDSDGNEQTVTATVENGTYTVDAETPLSEGEYSVEASVTDPAGNTATSDDVGEIDASAPALTVDAPALTSDTTPTIVGTTDAGDGSTVTLVITDSDGNEQTVTATVENGTYSVDAETPLSEGEYSVEASVTDPAGNTATSNDVGEIDASAPALTVDAPALTSDTTPTIVGTTDAEDGSTVTLVITDSDGNEQTVTATVENGTYTVDAETPLSEGEYSVEASVTDPAGNTATSNDVGALIGGDSGEVTEDGVTEASGALVDVESTDVVAGTQSDDYGTFSVNEAGEWTYTLDNDAAVVQGLNEGDTVSQSFVVELSDGSTTTVDILITGMPDAAPIITGISGTDDNSVTEATGDTVAGSFTVAATAGIATVTIAGADADTPVDITNATEVDPVVIEGSEGTLSVTGYNADTGTVTYRYVEDGETEDHSGGDITDSFAVVVTDITDASTTDSLDIAIVDTVPTANADTGTIAEDTTDALTGNVISGSGDSTDADAAADALGSDTPTLVTGVVTGTLEDDDALAANVNDTTGTEIAGSYGTLTLNSDGSYSYVLDNGNAEVQSLNDDSDPLSDVFTYGITDADGDASRTTLTITVTGSTDAAPVITGISGTDDNSVTEATGDTVTGSFTVAATAGIDTVTVNGTDITGASEADPVELTTDEGTLTVTGYDADSGEVTYSYVEDGESEDHTGGDITDSFTVVVTDITGQSTSDSLDIAIVDTAPTANDDARSIDEDATALDGNVISGDNDTTDTLGADATSVTSVTPDGGSASDVTADDAAVVEGTYGTLTLNSDGSYSYVLDTTSPAVQSLNNGETEEDTFTYVITDADGDSDTATLTITVEGSTDGVPTITDISGDEADHSLTEATGDSVTGSFTVAATAGIDTVTVNGTDITGATEADPVELTTDEGTLTVTGYDADSGEVTYSYVEDGESEDHTGGDITDSFTVVVTDITGQSTSDSLDIAIVDTAPTANDDARSIDEDATALDGNVISGDNDTTDTLGADATSVTSVTRRTAAVRPTSRPMTLPWSKARTAR